VTAFTVVVETSNYGEDTSLERVREVLGTLAEQVGAEGDGEVLLSDESAFPEIRELVENEFPDVRRVDVTGVGYDGAKVRGAAEARGAFVLQLDCDTVPERGWLSAMLDGLRQGDPVVGGFTYYEGGLWARLNTLTDFGFLAPLEPHDLGCYASNNVGFQRSLLAECPMTQVAMRCSSYVHSQRLLKRGTPAVLAPGARVRHPPPPFVRERFRRGYDVVAAGREVPDLAEARLMRSRALAPAALPALTLWWDFRRLRAYWRDLGFSRFERILAFAVVPFMRCIDLAGIVWALTPWGHRPPPMRRKPHPAD
jgi:hypothetical protein